MPFLGKPGSQRSSKLCIDKSDRHWGTGVDGESGRGGKRKM
jgi:hypothetical protein